MDCIFCKIINREIPAEIVYEDNETIAVLDINPVTKGHALVLPKKHVKDFLTAPKEVICETIEVAQKIAPKILEAVGVTDFNLITNNGPSAGQSIDHLHFHLIPRGENFPKPGWPTIEYEEGEMKEIAKRINNY